MIITLNIETQQIVYSIIIQIYYKISLKNYFITNISQTQLIREYPSTE